MRASRLVGLLGLLQARGRMSAWELAGELEVSQRTILRGCSGGFELIEGFRSDLPVAASPRHRPAPDARAPRARVRLSPRGRRLAALLGRPAGIRIRRSTPAAAGREGWVEAWVRIGSLDAAALDMLALGAEAEVIHPPELRALVGRLARRIADLHADGDGP
jgi:predicted DNA-binding transcriptional regulator YafY